MRLLRYLYALSIVIGGSCNSQAIKSNIVLINVRELDREGIANEVRIISSFNPSIIAIDVQFPDRTEYSKDWALCKHSANHVLNAISFVKNFGFEVK
jgi:hypothetical protein